jgi:hypothetical protein
MLALTTQAATIAKVAPRLLAHPGFSFGTAKLLMSRIVQDRKSVV